MNQGLTRFLVISFGLHLAAFVLFWISPNVFKHLPKKSQKVTWVKVSKGTTKKAAPHPFKKIKDMPYWTVRDQKMALKERAIKQKANDKKTTKSEIKKNKKKKVASNKKTSPKGGKNFEKKTPVKKNRTIDDALARIEEQLKKREAELEAAQVKEEGGGLSPDGNLNVQDSEVSAIIAEYVTGLKSRINRQWITNPKVFESNQTLKTQLNVRIDSQGNLIDVSFEQRSGDMSFDLSAKRAVERSAPFPVPPTEIRSEALSEGFLIEFSPKSVISRT